MFGSLGWGLAIFIVATILGTFVFPHSFNDSTLRSLSLLIRSVKITYILCLWHKWTTRKELYDLLCSVQCLYDICINHRDAFPILLRKQRATSLAHIEQGSETDDLPDDERAQCVQ